MLTDSMLAPARGEIGVAVVIDVMGKYEVAHSALIEDDGVSGVVAGVDCVLDAGVKLESKLAKAKSSSLSSKSSKPMLCVCVYVWVYVFVCVVMRV